MHSVSSPGYHKAVDELERQLLTEKINTVKAQNKIFYEAKARELLDKRKSDSLSLASANLLFKSLNMKPESIIAAPTVSSTRIGSNAEESNTDQSK